MDFAADDDDDVCDPDTLRSRFTIMSYFMKIFKEELL